MGDKSNFNMRVSEYMKKGLREEKAQRKAWLGIAEDIAFDMLGGFVSGSVHAAPKSAITYAKTQNQYVQTGNAILEADGGVEALKQAALEVAAGLDADAQAELQGLAEGKTRTSMLLVWMV